MYALIIGVNKYQHHPLSGAVADAKSVEKFLYSKLHVPPSHIRTRINEEANCKGILGAFLELHRDTRIKRGDPILIYFAGHGTTVKDPDDANKSLQCIVPYDSDQRLREGLITDRTLARLLCRIAEGDGGRMEGKGDNIVRWLIMLGSDH